MTTPEDEGPSPAGFRGDWGRLSAAERAAVRYLLSGANPRGNRAVEAVPVSLRLGQRTPDFRVDGVPVELKTVGGVRIAGLVGEGLTKKLSGAIASRIMDARGQAPNVVVDLREQEGITLEIAETAVGRAFGADARAGIESVRFIGPGFDETYTRRRR